MRNFCVHENRTEVEGLRLWQFAHLMCTHLLTSGWDASLACKPSCLVDDMRWAQVVRERELHLHLGSNHVRAIPQMQTHGRLAAPLPPGFAALEGAEAVLLAPLGEELGPLPLSPHDVLAIAADVLGALIELIVGRPSCIVFPAQS